MASTVSRGIELSSIDTSDDEETPLLNNQPTYPDAYRFNLICILCFLSGLYFNNKSTLEMNTDSAGESGDRIENTVATGNTGINRNGNITEKKAISIIGCVIFGIHVVFHLTNLSLSSMVEICRIANNTPYICENFPDDHNKSNCLLPQEYWKFSVATTIASFGSVVSYLLISVYILIPRMYCDKHCELPRDKNDQCCQVCCLAHRKAFKQPISPFTSSSKSFIENFCFHFHYIAVLFLFVGVLICATAYVSYTYFSNSHNPSCVKNTVDIIRIVLQLVGLFCVIQSCFIFLKIVCCITEQLDDLEEKMDKQDKENPRSEEQANHAKNEEKMIRIRYYRLQEIDQNFIDRIKPILDLYGVWFIFHWMFYSLTSVLHSAVIVELVLDVVSYRVSSTDEYVPSTKPEIEAPYILYIVFFTVLHAYLFIYPCFRAAAIASAHQKLSPRKNGTVFRWQFKATLLSTLRGRVHQFLPFCTVFKICIKRLFLKLC